MHSKGELAFLSRKLQSNCTVPVTMHFKMPLSTPVMTSSLEEEESIVSLIRQMVTKISNPVEHHLNFSKLVQEQGESESISYYLVRLKSTARIVNSLAPIVNLI